MPASIRLASAKACQCSSRGPRGSKRNPPHRRGASGPSTTASAQSNCQFSSIRAKRCSPWPCSSRALPQAKNASSGCSQYRQGVCRSSQAPNTCSGSNGSISNDAATSTGRSSACAWPMARSKVPRKACRHWLRAPAGSCGTPCLAPVLDLLGDVPVDDLREQSLDEGRVESVFLGPAGALGSIAATRSGAGIAASLALSATPP